MLSLLQYHGAPLHYTDLLSDCNLVFTILFTIECVMKLSSFGYKVNRVRWQQFESSRYFVFFPLALFQRFVEHL